MTPSHHFAHITNKLGVTNMTEKELAQFEKELARLLKEFKEQLAEQKED